MQYKMWLWSGLAMLVTSLANGQAVIQNPEPVPQDPPVVLKEMPNEIKHEGSRIFDIKLEPSDGIVGSNGRIVVKFKYETDAPGKIYVGGMPLHGETFHGGYQPATLQNEKGETQLNVICGAPPPSKPVTTLEEMRASYVPVDTMELQIYGQIKKQAKFRFPVKFQIIPHATFTVQEKFYLDRLLQEVIALRKRVQALEAKQQ